MGLTDFRGLSVSTSNRNALAKYDHALMQYHGFAGNPVGTVNDALELDPEFILAHCFRAVVYLLAMERKLERKAARNVAAAEALATRANDRERRHIAAVRAWLDGYFERAAEHWEAILLEHPHDGHALQAAHLADFFLGHTAGLRDRIARVLPAWSPEVPGYGFVLGMYAFGLEECGDYGRAEELGRRAVETCPKDVWAIHAVTHVLEMQGRFRDGVRWMSERESDWSPDNLFAIHNWWHLALFHLEAGETDRVLEIYDHRIRGARSEVALNLLDASALLWRLRLLGIDTGDRWRELADMWEPLVDDAYNAFNDMHAMMAFVADDRDTAADALLRTLERVGPGDGTNNMMVRDVGLPVCRALRAHGRGDFGAAVELLLPVRYLAHRVGGSHAQRDVIGLTLVDAALGDGQRRLARALVSERTELRPTSPINWQLGARALEALGDRRGAKAARDRVRALRRS